MNERNDKIALPKELLDALVLYPELSSQLQHS